MQPGKPGSFQRGRAPLYFQRGRAPLYVHSRAEPGSTCTQARRAIISFLISAMASAGFRPFGQVREQFMMVWQR